MECPDELAPVLRLRRLACCYVLLTSSVAVRFAYVCGTFFFEFKPRMFFPLSVFFYRLGCLFWSSPPCLIRSCRVDWVFFSYHSSPLKFFEIGFRPLTVSFFLRDEVRARRISLPHFPASVMDRVRLIGPTIRAFRFRLYLLFLFDVDSLSVFWGFLFFLSARCVCCVLGMVCGGVFFFLFIFLCFSFSLFFVFFFFFFFFILRGSGGLFFFKYLIRFPG